MKEIINITKDVIRNMDAKELKLMMIEQLEDTSATLVSSGEVDVYDIVFKMKVEM